jgi:Tol biopolymer transport system component/DNA-binding winged helix-turn-helix (wHTH) protein
MEESTVEGRSVRFGTFEADIRAGELRKHGLKVRLQEQPFQILVMLLERPGEVVTREEVRKKLWPADTFVDFDHSLNSAIGKIRDALCDSADNPRFVETLARRGYRFIAPVERIGPGTPQSRSRVALTAVLPSPVPTPDSGDITRRAVESTVEAVLEVDRARTRWRKWALVLAGSTLLLAVFLLWPVKQPPPRVLRFTQITDDGRQKLISVELGSPLLTDGSRLYFGELDSGRNIVAQASNKGGETASLPSISPLLRLADISPDRSELLVAGFVGSEGDAPLWAVPVSAGTPHRLGDLIGHDGTWLPDGAHLVYARGRELFLAARDGTGSRKLVTLPGVPFWPRWSPDGETLRFTVNDPKTEESSLWEISASGNNLRQLLPAWNGVADQCCGNWTPDGKYFVFESVHNGRSDIWMIRERGGLSRKADRTPVQLTAGPMRFHSAVPSDDGRKLFVIGAQRRGELVRYDSGIRLFVSYLSGISAEAVDFSRDGQWMTYVAYPEGTLWRGRLDGSQRLQLTLPSMETALPRWSPDGKQIAFMCTTQGKPWKTCLVSAEGGSPNQITSGAVNEADPNWSPDGGALVFGGAPWAEGAATGSTAIHVMDLIRHRVKTLPGSEGLFSPRWSPNGRYIAALPADSSKLVLVDLRTGEWADLANLPAGYPSWSRDGKYVYFESPGSNQSVYRVRISDRKLERVVSLKGVRRAFGTLAPWLGLSPDDSPLAMRDLGTEEIYALDWKAP